MHMQGQGKGSNTMSGLSQGPCANTHDCKPQQQLLQLHGNSPETAPATPTHPAGLCMQQQQQQQQQQT
jgi:hypothetical protein